MEISVTIGDILDEAADLMVSTANTHLNMSGGVNGAILERGGESVQAELRAHLRTEGRDWVEPGTVVTTQPGPLNVQAIIHAVGIDGFYESSIELVCQTIQRVLSQASRRGGGVVAMPAIATGYGPLTAREFATALGKAVVGDEYPGITNLKIVLRRRRAALEVAEELERLGIVPRVNLPDEI